MSKHDIAVQQTIQAMYSILTKHQATYDKEKAKLDKIVQDCSRTKTTPADGYWMPEHSAWVKLETIKHLIDVMEKYNEP